MRSAMGYPHIFKPLRLRHKELRNRIVFGAHTTNMAEDGLPGARHTAYYRERAMGGAAMIVVEPIPVHPAAVLTRGNFRPCSDEVITPFRQMVEACQAEGAVMIQQLYHVGAHGDWDNSWHAHWSPSGGPSYHDNDGSHEMTEDEIEETIAGFVAAARRCQQAGFDGVEVWAAYHCLLDQFWVPFSNQRDDRWGGSLENRTRFSREILRRIRAACGEDFIVGLAVNDEPDSAVMLDHDEMVQIIALHDAEGLMDYVTVGMGSYLDFYKIIPSFQYGEMLSVDLCTRLKAELKTALVISEAQLRTPENANTVLGAGQADMVSIVRGQIADPHLVAKAQGGRDEDIRGCLSCNQQCWGRRGRDYWISCVVNPSAGHEAEWGGDRFTAARSPARVLVVGGGPAGLEAVRVAAERGHQVSLAEAGPALGGRFMLAGWQPRRGQITELIAWYERQLDGLGVKTRLNCYLDADEIAEFAADHVILATGALPDESGFQKAMPHVPALPGVGGGGICTAEDVMARAARPGSRVIVLDEGGAWRAIGTAWKLAQDGHVVTIVTPDAMVAQDLQRSATDGPARRTLAGLGVRFVVESAITRWHAGQGAEVVSLLTGKAEEIAADTLVLAAGVRADTELAAVLRTIGRVPILIGDALAPRNAAAAIHEGRKCALTL